MKRNIVLWLLLDVLVVLSIPSAYSQSSGQLFPDQQSRGPKSPAISKAPAQPRAQTPRSGVPVYLMRAGHCTAFAPRDWKVLGVDPTGRGIAMSNGTFSAGYTIEAFDSAVIYFEPYRGDPHLNVQKKTEAASQAARTGSLLQMSAVQQYGDMFVREFDFPGRHALMMYSVYPMSMGGYVLILRSVWGPKQAWQSYAPVAINISSSIRCQAQYTPSPGGDVGGHGSRGSSAESTYNVQLGTEYAHDPETGETFLMHHSTDWLEAGPDGPGYYRSTPGGGRRKLTPGVGH